MIGLDLCAHLTSYYCLFSLTHAFHSLPLELGSRLICYPSPLLIYYQSVSSLLYHESGYICNTCIIRHSILYPNICTSNGGPFPLGMQSGSLYFDALGLTYNFCSITAMHAQTAGHDIMIFEMLRKTFRGASEIMYFGSRPCRRWYD